MLFQWLRSLRYVPPRGTNRLFLVGAASAAHTHYLTERLTALQHGPWAKELIVY